MPERLSKIGDMIEPADKITSRPARASAGLPLTVKRTPVARLPSVKTFSTKAPVITRTLPRAMAGRR